MTTVLHLMPRAEWDRLVPEEPVINPSLATEGFIHCTDDEQVLLGVANAFYRTVTGDFVVLDVEVSDLTSACIWEAPAHIGGDTPSRPLADQFPHIYGPIDRAAVRRVREVLRDDGRFVGYGSTEIA
ncbi:MAG: hypothetical protein JWL72_1584 [Ilumatobacteraceae bacterium]|nr:hypothetical protein [Ilumatobacteraceae bacterium]MCU1388246.1 hypothetical protein [Ilumatobacteraceae bacterium]